MREVAFLKSLPKTISKIEEKLKGENNWFEKSSKQN
jgi:hypothetical protein